MNELLGIVSKGGKFDWDVQEYILYDAFSGSNPATNTITLDTPVPVGESFTMVSLCVSEERGKNFLVTAELQTPVSGEWTEVYCRREDSNGFDNYVIIKVITSKFFSVQMHTRYGYSDSAEPFTYTFSTVVDWGKTFLVGQLTGGENEDRCTAVFESTSTTSFTIDKDTDFGETISTVTYIVTIDYAGAEVEEISVSMSGTTASANLANGQSNTWAIYTFYVTERDESDVIPLGKWNGNSQYDFSRVTSAGSTEINAFFITIPTLVVERKSFDAGDFPPQTLISETINSATVGKTLINPVTPSGWGNARPDITGVETRERHVSLYHQNSTTVQYRRSQDVSNANIFLSFESITTE